MANADWLALAVTAHNLGRAVGALARMSRATAATLRRRLFTIPGQLVHTARRLHLRLCNPGLRPDPPTAPHSTGLGGDWPKYSPPAHSHIRALPNTC